MSWQFTVGLRVKRKADRIVVDAEKRSAAMTVLVISSPLKASKARGSPIAGLTKPRTLRQKANRFMSVRKRRNRLR